jgi:hypothetical protein
MRMVSSHDDLNMRVRHGARFTRFCFTLIAVCVVIGIGNVDSQFAAQTADSVPTNLNEVLSRMINYRRWYYEALLGYQAQRQFHAASQRFNMNSKMEVETVFLSPDSLHSTVIKQEGSSLVRQQVFEKILHAETEAATQIARDQTDIIPQNYRFGLIGMEDCEGRQCWHLTITPKRKDKYLLDGMIWIDAADYAICRIHGVTSKRPSLWVSQVEIDKRYRKIDQLWLADRIESSADVFLAGHTTVMIESAYGKITVASLPKLPMQ